MKTKLAIAITSALALSACVDDYTLDSQGSSTNSMGTVAVVGEAEIGYTLTAAITDNDGFDAEAVTYTWYQDNAPTDNTQATWLLAEADVDTVLSVEVAYVDNGGKSEVAISEFTDPVLDIAVPYAGSVELSGDAYVGYPLTAVVSDENGASKNPITYTWMAEGAIIPGADEKSYELTASEENKTITVRAQYTDDRKMDEDVTSLPSDPVLVVPDGYVENKIAKLFDESTSQAGVLRVKLKEVDDNADPYEVGVVGKVSVSFAKEVVMAGDTAKEAYIGLMGTSTSTYAAMFDLRIGNGTYTVRTPKTTEFPDGQRPLQTDVTFTPGDWIDVDITWDATAATDDVGPLITCYIDGVEVWAGNSESDNLEAVKAGVEVVNLKLSDDGSILTEGVYRVDDLVIYKDIAGTEVAFSDDFEGYAVDYDLDSAVNSDSKYNASGTEQAVVSKILVPGEE